MVKNKTNYSKLADYYDLIYSITPPNDRIFYKKFIGQKLTRSVKSGDIVKNIHFKNLKLN